MGVQVTKNQRVYDQYKQTQSGQNSFVFPSPGFSNACTRYDSHCTGMTKDGSKSELHSSRAETEFIAFLNFSNSENLQDWINEQLADIHLDLLIRLIKSSE